MPAEYKCLTKNNILQSHNVIYKAKTNYIGSTEITLKRRWNSHNSFETCKDNGTELAKYILHLKSNKINYDIKWSDINHNIEI